MSDNLPPGCTQAMVDGPDYPWECRVCGRPVPEEAQDAGGFICEFCQLGLKRDQE